MRTNELLDLIWDAKELLSDAIAMKFDDEFVYACKEELDILEWQYATAYVAKHGNMM